MSEWRTGRLGDWLEFRNGGASTLDDAGDFAVFGANGVYGRSQEANLRVPASVIGRVGSYCGSVHYAPESAWVSENALIATPRDGAPARFWYFALAQLELNSWRAGSGQPLLNQGILRNIPFVAPPLGDQHAIAEVLGALDDKIAANTKLIDRLLAVVNTEFVRRFGDRSLEVMLGALAEVVDCLHSKKPERTPHGSTLMQLNNIRDDGLVDRTSAYCISAEDYAAWSRRFETRAWDFVITNVGRIGAVARIPDGYVAALGRNMTGIRPKVAAESGSFIAAALLSSAVRREIDQRTDAGSVMSALNVRSVPVLRLQDSSPSERKAFHEFASPFLENADTALSESASLAATRDALLPPLMSGELRVRDAEKLASEAGA
ncbi:restriction endonuclease subunit S [Streptomyces sp. ISL-90]|nr:restriction endonuclease subunit S [Streptomyces sp. ISL-90]